jgi:putative signal transducing protein
MTWVACYQAPSDHEAHMARGFLEGRGVPCLLRRMGPSVYPLASFGTEVLVPDEWLPVARRALARRRRPTRRVLRLPARRRRA